MCSSWHLACCALGALLALTHAYPNGDRQNLVGRRFTPCHRLVEEGGTNVTAYDAPCAFSAATLDGDAGLFRCAMRCKYANEQAGRYTSYCVPKRCSTDADCYQGDGFTSTCEVRWRDVRMCTTSQEHRQYVSACQVQDEASGAVVRTRPCIRQEDVCQTSDEDALFTLGGATYRAFYCHEAEDEYGVSEEDFDED